MPEYMTEIKKELEDLLEKFDEYDRHIHNANSSPEEGFYEIRNTITNKITYYDGFLEGMAYQGASLDSNDYTKYTEIKKGLEDLLEEFDEYDRHILNANSSPEEGFYAIRNTITNKITHYDSFLKGMAYQGASFNSDDDNLDF